MPQAVQRSTLARRFFAQTAAISVGLLLVAGGTEAVFAYREALSQMARLQSLQATAAAAEIEQYLQTLQRNLLPIQALPWGQAAFGNAQRREELHRALALNPAVMALQDFTAAGAEVLTVSRTEPDRVMPAAAAHSNATEGNSARATGFGTPYFDTNGRPQVQLVLPRQGVPAGPTVVVLNLSFLGDVLANLRVAQSGDVYLLDKTNRLIAHADPTQLQRERPPPSLSVAAQDSAHEARDGPGLNGGRTLSTAITLPATQWRLVVEQAHSQAMQPVWATLWRTVLLMAVAGVVALLASAAFARRMAAPIATLRQATAKVAAGHWSEPWRVRTGDEIEGLAQDFNTMSARLQQSYGELEHKVVERTAELAQRRDEAERANAAKTRFLASASHDLRQPMHAIGLLVSLLRDRTAEAEQRDLADKTHQAVQSMETLFASLLDVSKLDAGAVKAQPQTLLLPEFLQRLGHSYAPLAAAKGLRLKVRVVGAKAGKAGPSVHTDPALLERLLGNLLSNAIRYTQRGGVLLACRSRGEQLLLQVFDTGIGIDPSQQAAVLEEFVRLDTSRSGEQGLGLGLAIVKRTAELLGLTIRLRSMPGKGSVFEVQMQAAQVPPPLPASAPLPPQWQQALQGAFVWVVDDDSRNREATAALLRHHGCLVVEAASAAAALHELTQHLRPPDALVTDFYLGAGDNGLALLDQLREACGSTVPALLITAETQLPRQLTVATLLLHKPAGTEKLLASLARALEPGA
jgi:signal transduction histidine kinase/CheY-like chemotaxis protein